MKKFIGLFIVLQLITLMGTTQQKPAYGLYADRDVYVSGETLLAKIFLPGNIPSRVVCLDLVNQNGTRITGAVLAIHGNEADGYLQLPDSLSSGTYLLRSYQKYNAKKIKTVREIWIANRFEGLDKTSGIKRVVSSLSVKDQITRQIEISNLDPVYKTNSKAEVAVTMDKSLLEALDGNLLVSVAQTDQSFDPFTFSVQDEKAKDGIIEKNGLIISGTVADKKTLEPVNNMIVYLTVPDSIPGFQYYKTNSDGRFYFLLANYYGPVQVFIQCFGSTPAQKLTIQVDDFFVEPGAMPEFRNQPVGEQFKKRMVTNISAITLRKIFGQEVLTLLPPPQRTLESYPYYGIPTHTVDPQEFIDLPDFTEISRELLPGVKFRNYNNEPSLQVFNKSTRNFFEGKPLLLLDGIPVGDLNVIKSMGTSDIKRIDICQSERFYGDLRFQGVLALYTAKADYSRLPESSQLLRLKLDAIQLPYALTEPIGSEPTVPDLRQLLYWNPSTSPTQNFAVKYSTSTIEGSFKITIRGRLKDGTMIYSEKNFEVK